MYIVIKKKGDPLICGSIKAVTQQTKLSENVLYRTFSRKKLKKHISDDYIIIKSKIIRAK